jgi:uncharacterized protein YxjI
MQKPFPKFFEGNEYFIDEKVNLLKFENEYKVYDGNGQQIGSVIQKISLGQKFLRLLINKKMMPFHLEILDVDGNIQATIRRGWTFWMSKIHLHDSLGTHLGTIKQKFTFLKPIFHIFSSTENKIAEISGDWAAWSFWIIDQNGIEIGNIDKKWAGVMKEIFTSADKYNVSIVPAVLEDRDKIVIVATAITIDMVLKETK